MNIDEDEGRKSETDLIAYVLGKVGNLYCLRDCLSVPSLYMFIYIVDLKYIHVYYDCYIFVFHDNLTSACLNRITLTSTKTSP